MNQEEILQQGYLIIHKIDTDNHGYIEIEGFIRAYINHRFFTNGNQIKVVFDYFDADRANSASLIEIYPKFFQILRNKNEKTKKLIKN